MRSTERWIDGERAALEGAGLLRRLRCYRTTGARVAADTGELINFSCNDYLGLSRHPRVRDSASAALQAYGAGATASRLVVGTLPCHEDLEQQLARLKGYPAALAFGSGYAANMGILGAVVGRGDHIFVDRLAHASLIDAAMLSRASLHRFLHNDVDHCAALVRRVKSAWKRGTSPRCIVVTESVFSMDGDVAPLPELAALARREELMMLVDEAHATGVFGPGGSGLVRELGLESTVNLSMGTLSKALGSQGGFVACSREMRDWLIQKARSFIYSTGLAPAVAGAALGAVAVLDAQPGLGPSLLARAHSFRDRLREQGLDTGPSQSQIIPIMLGEVERAMRIHRRLLEQGVLVIPIRPPTVPAGTARLRLSVTLDHTPEQLDMAASCLVAAIRREGGL